MIAQINALIDNKLRLLFTSQTQDLPLVAFKESGKSKLQDAKILVEMMLRKGLISPVAGTENYQLTDFGKQICENGGWVKHLENLRNSNLNSTAGPLPSVKKTSWKEILRTFIQPLTGKRAFKS